MKISLFASLLLLCAVFFVSNLVFGAESKFPDVPNCPVVAHRGNSIAVPENTLAACRSAIEVEADGCEFDVRLSKDGKIIVLHDSSLNRTTNISSEIIDGKPKPIEPVTLTLEEIRQLDAGSWKNATFAGEKIPSFDDVLDLFQASDTKCRMIIEIKVPGIEKNVLDALHKAKLQDHCVIIAFSKDVLKKIRQLDPNIPVAWLWGEEWKKSEDELVEMLIQSAKEVNTNILDLNHGRLSKSIVEKLRDQGIMVWAWTVDDPEKARKLLDWGVTSITTNDPVMIQKVFEENKAK